MKRREFVLAPALCAWPGLSAAQPAASPIPETHFPSRLHLFVWRNWELANADRMARVLKTSASRVLELGNSMGLPRKPSLTPDQLKRLYVTVIRQNWQVLPGDQIIELLGWDRARFEFTLKEDDFLSVKLGPKPHCAPLLYAPPTAAERKRAAEIAATVREVMGSAINETGEPLFHFVRELSQVRHTPLRDASAAPSPGEIDLTSGWRIAAPEHPVAARAVARFAQYLEETMGVRLGTGESKTLRVEMLAEGDAFRIQSGASGIRVAGRGEGGVFAALDFLRDRMEERGGPFLAEGTTTRNIAWDPRYVYSYFALYGDPLTQPEIDPFPDGLLEKLAHSGINGVWMQAVLNTLAPSPLFPEFGSGSETRLANLGKLVARAREFGVKVYLYLNEPRAMPAAFFAKHPEARGREERGMYTMCTSAPEVREWIAASLAHVLEQVPGLGGFFTITMSENLTNCFSHGGGWGPGAPNAGDCPRCSKRKSWEAIGELIGTFREGIRRAGSSAELINWDWGWGDELARNLIPLLPRDSRFLSVSEWDQPVHRGGVDTKVGEYSLSVVGPGPRAKRNWALAREHGIRTMARASFNNSWEMSAVPYIPVPHLVLRHCENLSRSGVSGVMPSWTCGGYPSPNLAAAKAYFLKPRPEQAQVLESVAARRYGRASAPHMIEAWRRFSAAFEEFPYGVAIYTIPVQHGPANLLRLRPTGYGAAMMLFPHDDLKNWCGPYPPEAVLAQFRKMTAGWRDGLAPFRAGMAQTAPAKRRFAAMDLAIAETCANHFESVANQVEFYICRRAKPPQLARMKQLAEREIELARRQYALARRHSVIAYEASNHYYYTPLDLVEKILNCRDIIAGIAGQRP